MTNLVFGGGSASDYDIEQSLRFNTSDGYLSRTFPSAGNQKTWTYSGWIKKAKIDNAFYLFATDYSDTNNLFYINFRASHATEGKNYTGEFAWRFGSATTRSLRTEQKFRDCGAWMHICGVCDTGNATDTNRLRLYVNGEEITSFSTDERSTITQNDDLAINRAGVHEIGAWNGTNAADGYLADVHFIDGTALTPASFGETDADTNQWKPIEVTGLTYGTNGFYQSYSATELASSFEDSAERSVHTMTAVGNAQIDTAIKKIGTAGGLFDGTGDVVTVDGSNTTDTNNDFIFGANDFTLEAWIYPSSSGAGEDYFIGKGAEGAYKYAWTLQYTHTSSTIAATFQTGTTDAAGAHAIITGSTYATDTWHHVALTRSGSTFTLWVNGSSTGTITDSDACVNVSGADNFVTIGGITNTAGTAYDWNGSLDEARISDNCRYTGAFTPSTTAFTADVNTLLLLHMDGADGATTFTDSSWTGPRHTITAVGDVANSRDTLYKVETFLSGTTSWTAPAGITSVEYLVVGSGGGGGGVVGGGGGAGDFKTGTLTVVPATSYTATVGAGGAGGVGNADGSDGNSSIFSTITSIGGGGGGYNANNGHNGASGGGGAHSNGGTAGTGGSGTGTNGNDGGDANNGVFPNGASGGGGGSGGAGGSPGGTTGGSGGAGTSSSISGSSLFYAAGGGGWGGGGVGTGGSSVGGAGSTGSGSANGSDATANRGSGGGGAANGGNGGAGSAGIVIIRYIQPTPGTSSIKFDGTGDKLTTPSSSDWNPYGISFTAEFWLNVDSFAHTYDWLLGNTGVDNTGWNIQLQSSGSKLNFLVGNGSSWDINTVSSATGYAISTGTWYHVAVVKNGTAWTMYVDGTSRATGTSAASDYTNTLQIGASTLWASDPRDFDGYMDEIRISDSARYTANFTPSTTAFTADANTKLLIHSDFNGGLGQDSSGNKNDFTVTNLLVTDQVIDTPTNNFATFNPLVKSGNTFSEGNLKVTCSTSTPGKIVSTIGASSGKWYAEYLHTGQANFPVGIAADSQERDYLGMSDGSTSIAWWPSSSATSLYINGSAITWAGSTTTWANGDIVGFALNADDEEISIYKNGTLISPAVSYSSYNWTQAFFAGGNYVASLNYYANFGQDSSFAGNKTAQGNGGTGEDFYYTPPTGFVALNTDNLSDPSIALPTDHFDTQLWTGTGSGQTFSNFSFQPDFLWFKQRNGTSSHALFDSVRGVNAGLDSASTVIENTVASASQDLVSFDDDGFTTGIPSQYGSLGSSTNTIATWAWKGGGTAVSNTDGLVDTQVSANVEAGISIVTYTSDGTTTAGHGLSQAPELIIVKRRNSAADWIVGGEVVNPDAYWQYGLKLNTDVARFGETAWFGYQTAPTATVFPLGNSVQTNTSGGTYVAYCFHSVEGYSKVGTYVGNGVADGAFCYTGMKPAFLLVKNIQTAARQWFIFDSARDTYNTVVKKLYPNLDNAEADADAYDFVSNGFKVRSSDANWNTSGESYMYLAFAESPFKTSNAR